MHLQITHTHASNYCIELLYRTTISNYYIELLYRITISNDYIEQLYRISITPYHSLRTVFPTRRRRRFVRRARTRLCALSLPGSPWLQHLERCNLHGAASLLLHRLLFETSHLQHTSHGFPGPQGQAAGLKGGSATHCHTVTQPPTDHTPHRTTISNYYNRTTIIELL